METQPESTIGAAPKVSVIVCTHNPRTDYLNQVLGALQVQTLQAREWELLVVDNASQDPVAPRFDISWHPNGRHAMEPTLGLTPARLRGIAESKADLLVFVDDDNVLDTDYLEQASRLAHEYPFLGAWGGQLLPEFEREPPEWTQRYWPMLAIATFSRDVWSNLTDQLTTTPCGAGLCVRARVAKEYARLCNEGGYRRNLDRRGASLASCGDSDLALMACDLGLGTGRFVRLQLKHLIPPSRLTVDYLSRLAEEMTFSGHLLGALRGHRPSAPARQRLVGRLIKLYHRWRLPHEHRSIHDARLRGLERARQAVRI